MCLESALKFLDQASIMSDQAVAKIDSMVVETLGDWDDGDDIISEMDVIAEIDRIVEDMLADYPGARFESRTVGNSTALERYSVGLELDRTYDLVNECIPAFQITFPHEDASSVEAKYLVWAYDILSHGWWHLVPFQVKKPVSVFGLARKAVEWEEARKANPGLKVNVLLEARCYRGNRNSRVLWDVPMFSFKLKMERSIDDLGFGNYIDANNNRDANNNWDAKEDSSRGRVRCKCQARCTCQLIPLSDVNASLQDLFCNWPVDEIGSCQLKQNMRRWRLRYQKHYSGSSGGPCMSGRQFDELVVRTLGRLRVPLTEVSKAFRRAQRRQRIRERVAEVVMRDPREASLVKTIMGDLLPSHLVGVGGNKFQVVKEGEDDLRIPPRYLVWAYDILNHGWWGMIPISSQGLSLFGLAQKAQEWEAGGGRMYSLLSSCYMCRESVGRVHYPGTTCERCEKSWNPEEFWEWLRSRHFENIYDQLKRHTNHPVEEDIGDSSHKDSNHKDSNRSIRVDRNWLIRLIDEIGFDIPTGKKEATFEICDSAIEKYLPSTGYQSLSGRFMAFWIPGRQMVKKSPNGFCRWEHERLIVYRISSYCTNLVDPVPRYGLCEKPRPDTPVDCPAMISIICGGVSKSIPSFQIIFPQEEEWRVPARYLVWAYDILYWGWWHLVPFEVAKKPVSVFGLAQMAVTWDTSRKRDPGLRGTSTLAARCYKASYCITDELVWDARALIEWLKRRSASDVGFRGALQKDDKKGAWFIRLANVDDALHDLLDQWPVDEVGGNQFALNMTRWRRRYKGNIPPNETNNRPTDCLSAAEFDGLVVRMMGDLRVPLTEVSSEVRSTKRRQRIRERVTKLALTNGSGHHKFIQAIMSDSPPPYLMDISGNKFRMIKETETNLRIQPRYLVWAYDSLRHGWREMVPHHILSPGLSVFELARKASEWEAGGQLIHTLSASCYNCGEGSKFHASTKTCERCEKPWSPAKFWEWLRSRHFENICDQLKKSDYAGPEDFGGPTDSQKPGDSSRRVNWDRVDQDRWSMIIDGIGFDFPTEKEEPRYREVLANRLRFVMEVIDGMDQSVDEIFARVFTTWNFSA
ncbi:hypothetical protein GNI_101800 [Gregarina niphandrodes]|uniref:Uncharacterized protein n=1 Tax=Gregarina niphandrodes TaxID=110365 RepID=A0A023B4S7_GRENI|nr:hypothetical protein GNI_101800 [Gregarina niphandrodes]EZG56721.1 hypothetical protein GNI_101800 [Gregarina niphandrodes]|eukprot:XP_011131189.1 hypothetical protein GNI_101800 [Gregarina niphandrodes]